MRSLFFACAVILAILGWWTHLYRPARLAPDAGDRQQDAHFTERGFYVGFVLAAAMQAAMLYAWATRPLDGPSLVTQLISAIGFFVAIGGALLRAWAMRTLGRHFTLEIGIRDQHRLVSAGPYQWLMHPAYTGSIMVVVGFSLFTQAWLLAIAYLLSVAIFMVTRIRDEERMLTAHFGEVFERHKSTRKRLIPGIW